MRKPRSLLRELVGRASIARVAARFGHTPATVERWLRAGPPKGVAVDIADAYVRSEKARAATARRHAEREAREAAERLKKELRSERARAGWQKRRLEDARKAPGMPDYDGRTPGGHASLSALIDAKDPTWIRFLEFAESHGMTKRDAFNRWYSPKLRKGDGSKRQKRKKKPTRPKKRKPAKRKRR